MNVRHNANCMLINKVTDASFKHLAASQDGSSAVESTVRDTFFESVLASQLSSLAG